MDEANGDSGAAAAEPRPGDDAPPRRVPGQRDPATRAEPASPPAPTAPALAPAPTTTPTVPAQPAVRGPADDAPSTRTGATQHPEPGPDARAGSGHGSDAATEQALSDAELVDLVRGGRDSAYEELYRRHADAVRRYARTCCRDVHTAEDLTGEVFARTLQAIRGGSGPQSAVRAYLLTTVRRVAATWGNTARREHLVEDFAVFAVTATGSSATANTTELGADVRAMHEAERSLAIRAFRTLPERWQTVLWHTAVEDESPSTVAPLLGLTPNATAVLAHRAREGLRQAYLQAHVSASLTAEGECARFADRLGAHARGGLRMRADRELNRHLKECARCTAASRELADLNSTLKGLLPAAYIGWFAAAYAAKAAGLAAGGAAASSAASGAAFAATGATSGSAGAAAGATAAGEGIGAPIKVGVAAAVVVAAAATALALTLTGGHPKPVVKARPPATGPVATQPPPAPSPPPTSAPVVGRPAPTPTPRPTPPPPGPTPAPTHTPAPKPSVSLTPSPAPSPTPSPVPSPTPPPTPRRTPPATPITPPPPPVGYPVDTLGVGKSGSPSDEPTIRPSSRSWWWDRWGLSIGGTSYRRGVTVHAPSAMTIDLNRPCLAYDAQVGVDDLVRIARTAVRFSVYGDGTPLWTSGVVHAGDPAVPVHVGLTGYTTLRLVVEPAGRGGLGAANLSDWADPVITCR